MTPLETRMWYVYVLESQKTVRWYTGSTKDLRKRILRHNRMENQSTKHGTPWDMIYHEASLNRNNARVRERHLVKFFFAEGL